MFSFVKLMFSHRINSKSWEQTLPIDDLTFVYNLYALYWFQLESERQNTVLHQPIRAGFVLLLKSLHKGQSLRVALGEVCGMGKCGQPLLLS